VGIKAAVLMLLLLIAVSGMVITQHFAQLASMPQGHHQGAAMPAAAQQTRHHATPQLQPEPSDGRQRSTPGASILSYQQRVVGACGSSSSWLLWLNAELPHGCPQICRPAEFWNSPKS